MTYSAPYRTPALTHKSISGYGYDDYSRYPYGEPTRGEYDQGYIGAPYNESMYHSNYDTYGGIMPSRSQYGGYDDYGYDRNYLDRDMDYAQSYGAITPRRRRSSSMSYPRSYSMGGTNGLYDMYNSRGTGVIKFRTKGSFSSGVTLSEVVSGIRLAGEDKFRYHELNADARGRIYLKVRWNGYSSLTYEIPVDEYDVIRLSTLARRVGRACIHFMQSNRIPISTDRVKLYYLEEIYPGTWQPSLTIR